MSADIKNTKPIVKRKALQLISDCKVVGILIRITEAYRDSKRQAVIYAQGRTTPGPIVSNAKPGTSNHEFGIAFDICFDKSQHPYDGPWDKVIAIAAKIGLENGDMGYKDIPHFQYRAGYSDAQIRAGKIDNSKFA